MFNAVMPDTALLDQMTLYKITGNYLGNKDRVAGVISKFGDGIIYVSNSCNFSFRNKLSNALIR
jgi:hypothetical protein